MRFCRLWFWSRIFCSFLDTSGLRTRYSCTDSQGLFPRRSPLIRTYDNALLSLSTSNTVVPLQYFWLLAPLLMYYHMYGSGKRESESSREAGAIYQGEFAAIFGFVGCTCIQNSQEGIMSSLNLENMLLDSLRLFSVVWGSMVTQRKSDIWSSSKNRVQLHT